MTAPKAKAAATAPAETDYTVVCTEIGQQQAAPAQPLYNTARFAVAPNSLGIVQLMLSNPASIPFALGKSYTLQLTELPSA